jgi:hypothetical protein
MAKIAWQHILTRLNGLGISTPVFGVSVNWIPPKSEKEFAEKTIIYLENEGLLYVSFDYEHPKDCHQSADKIRDGLTTLLMDLGGDSPAYRSIDEIRRALFDFMRALERNHLEKVEDLFHGPRRNELPVFQEMLAKLRERCGQPLACLCVNYGIDLDDRLEGLLPAPSA